MRYQTPAAGRARCFELLAERARQLAAEAHPAAPIAELKVRIASLAGRAGRPARRCCWCVRAIGVSTKIALPA